MRFKKRALTAIGLLGIIGFLSCSRQTTIPTQLSYAPAPVFRIPDSLLKASEIDFAFYKAQPAQFYEPRLELRDSFTHLEKHLVGIADEELFARRPELIVDLENIADGAFTFPLAGARLLSAFGRRNGRMHTGMDLKINRRDTVVCAFDGIVRMAGWSRGYGNVVVVRHYNGLETVYAHNSKHLVHSGDHVTAGTPLCITGETGRATTDHVHFEIRVNGKPIDPTLIIDFNTQSLHHRCLVFSPDEKGKIKIETV